MALALYSTAGQWKLPRCAVFYVDMHMHACGLISRDPADEGCAQRARKTMPAFALDLAVACATPHGEMPVCVWIVQ